MAISLWQPWASLVACGAKRIETRSWQPPRELHGQRIAIHAAKTRAHLGDLSARMRRALQDVPQPLPLGALICTVRLDGSEPITTELRRHLSLDELAFGNYGSDRYAWWFEDVRPLDVPMPGRRGFFPVTLP